jgi:hypothetical protein
MRRPMTGSAKPSIERLTAAMLLWQKNARIQKWLSPFRQIDFGGVERHGDVRALPGWQIQRALE